MFLGEGMKCFDCRWSDFKHNRLKDVEGNYGYCRKHKPIPQGMHGRYYGAWPLVDINDYCGEFRQIPEKVSESCTKIA